MHKLFGELEKSDLLSDRISLFSLLIPVYKKGGISLIWFDRRPSQETVASLFAHASSQTTILTLSDLDLNRAFFAQDLAEQIEISQPRCSSARIEVKSIGIVPEQVGELKIPIVQRVRGSKEEERYRRYLKKAP